MQQPQQQQSSGSASASRLLKKHHTALASPERCHRLLEELRAQRQGAASRGGWGGLARRAAGLAWRLLLIYAFCSVSLNCLENTFPHASKDWRTGRALSYLNLLYLKSYRWLTVQLGLYRSEFLHSRDRDTCLIPNPLYQPPVMCCGCKPLPGQLPSVRLNNPRGRDAFRQSLDRHLTPFLVTDSGHRPVTYAELRQLVLDAWDDVNSGSNRIVVQNLGDSLGSVATTLSELMSGNPEVPPPALLTTWIYGHMTAMRAIRRLVPRPPFIRPDVDYSFARAFYMFRGRPEEDVSLGDLSEFHGAALLLGLHGSVRFTLSHKAECCSSNDTGSSGGVQSNTSVVLSPGQALLIPCQCYQVRAARIRLGDQDGGSGGEDYAMVHLFSLFSSTGIKQPAPITGRVPEDDDIAEDY